MEVTFEIAFTFYLLWGIVFTVYLDNAIVGSLERHSRSMIPMTEEGIKALLQVVTVFFWPMFIPTILRITWYKCLKAHYIAGHCYRKYKRKRLYRKIGPAAAAIMEDFEKHIEEGHMRIKDIL